MAEKDKSGGLVFVVVGGVVATLLSTFLLWLWTDAWVWLLAKLAGAWVHLFQSITLSNWQLYVLALLSAHSVVYWAWRLIPYKTFSHSRFVQDNFFGARWRWMYDTSGHPCNFVPYCVTCDGLLVYSEFLDDIGRLRTELHCEHCTNTPVSEEGGKQYVWSKAARHIERLVRTGEWEQRPGMSQQAK